MEEKINLNSLLDIMIIILLCHYVQGFHKCLVMLKNLMKIQQQEQQPCLLGLVIKNMGKS